ncbi:hypothetical protein A1O3_02891 [Capronia epimyces CBS 606.96]|uniref:STB6-like N-terminal domain-containing protein n=1 Tax=Capronia epimyces CBS 606.96 TaxID=1182542 RepID=W9Z5P4_9EURO|nr:uncharacterized protein A1O3_02891 [Capronia epimyces CBS 606.96]EXJ89824.1 hypothetical protein A1O3_02891 [Capronia epimyces CBS 606.96]
MEPHEAQGRRASNSIMRSPRQSRPSQGRKRLVFADPIAFRYLEEDPATDAIERWRRLQGYEMYLIEQWACSRTHPTFVICTYTGDPSHSIVVNVLSVPSDESYWSPRLQIYFQAVSQFHAKEKETPFGTLMVTNLSGFPSALTVIAVPDGEVRKHRDDFIVNENLKRMGCSGRAAISLQPPQPSTIAKFHHLYRTSETIPLYQSVMELVRICQTALVMYDKLQPTYADGLLCDVTERAINDWWTDIGTYFYNVEPSDGILGPTTVAALLGLLIGAYNRLKAFGSSVGKDILDTVSMKRAVGHFQKGQKMEKTRRLDRETLDRLHRATAKNASGEGWTVPKSVKSTVAELSGKGGEMMMGIVGARDKAGISDAETLDIDRFAQLVTGPRMKWLWHGKALKSGDAFLTPSEDLGGRVFGTDDQGNFLWMSNHQDSISDGGLLERTDTAYSNQTHDLKAVRSRPRGPAGGVKSHSLRHSRDGQETLELVETSASMASKPSKDHTLIPDHAMRPVGLPRQRAPAAFDLALANAEVTSPQNLRGQPLQEVQKNAEKEIPSHREQLKPVLPGDSPGRKKLKAEMAELRNEFASDAYRKFSAGMPYKGLESRALRRSQSAVQLANLGPNSRRQTRIKRQLSFSIVENAVLDSGLNFMEEGIAKGKLEGDLTNALVERDTLVAAAQRKANRIQRIQQGLIPYTENSVAHVESLEGHAHQHLEQLNEMYYHRLEEYQSLQATSSDLVSQEKNAVAEGFRRIEMLGAKMDYELDSLQSRLQEVEDGVDDFERSVVAIETRVKELIGGEKQNAVPWIQRLFSFRKSRK